MDFGSPPVQPETAVDSPFNVEGFKNLLATLKESKRRQEDKAKPTYDIEE
jgi:hypothetical protein